MNFQTCKVVIWGFKHSYNTFQHIHAAFYRAFQHLGRDVKWLDHESDLTGIDFSDTLFITVDVARLAGMPLRRDCFYMVHNLNQKAAQYLDGFKYMSYGLYVSTTQLSPQDVEVAPDGFVSVAGRSVIFRWATDLFPDEIEANKPTRAFRDWSHEVNFVGTYYDNVHGPFKKACEENGIKFNAIGGFSGTPPVSIEENIRLVQQSYMAPAIGDIYHSKVGYIPCRTFKNISYGQFGITNNPYVQEFFKGKLIYNADTYKLFYDARDRLPHVTREELYNLMDYVAENHTYLNRIPVLLRGAQMVWES